MFDVLMWCAVGWRRLGDGCAQAGYMDNARRAWARANSALNEAYKTMSGGVGISVQQIRSSEADRKATGGITGETACKS